MKTLPIIFALAAAASCCPVSEKTAGIGHYPGNAGESGAPALVSGKSTYRNLALNRATYQSSSFDYNLTSQLATDGIISKGNAPWLEVLTDEGTVERSRTENLFDGRTSTRIELSGKSPSLEIRFHNMPVSADKMEIKGMYYGNIRDLARIEGEFSTDGKTWKASGQVAVTSLEKNNFTAVVSLDGGTGYGYYRLKFHFRNKGSITLHTIDFHKAGKLMDVLPSRSFHSAWKSAGSKEEWIMTDLGAPASFDRMVFHWQNFPLSGLIQVSFDGQTWKDWQEITDTLIYGKGKARYIRAILKGTADGEPFELKEWEIFGRGGIVAEEREAPGREGNRQYLTRGGWKVCRSTGTTDDGKALSESGFDDQSWLEATVPGTVLASYFHAGAVPDPNHADNQSCISESFFRSDFWYRNTFTASLKDSERQFLNFDGINWKAEIYLNGKFLGKIDGAYRAAGFDVTGILRDGQNNLAVKVICNEHFGAVTRQDAFDANGNGGILGADNPTVHATIGWDWVPTVRGRSAGIIDDVYMTYTGPVTIENPFVRTSLPLPDTSYADIITEVTLVNHSDAPVSGVLKGTYGTCRFELPQTLEAGETLKVIPGPMRLDNPELWWPNGYGKAHLYDVRLSFETEDGISDLEEFKSGVRQMDVRFDESPAPAEGSDPERLNLYINGRRFVAFGGNWGLPEHMLGYRSREYDIAIGYHADMNFTMIRNWVGQTYDKEFYEACDRHGIVVWQDFWLANPADGPEPYDVERFNQTAEEYVRNIRNHPSIGIYVGRNEGYPPAQIDTFLRDMVKRAHPGIYYLSSSADGPVSGRGTYRALPVEEYYTLFGQDRLHSERGYPAVMNYENLVRALGADAVEPVSTLENPNPMYGLHDFALGNKPGTFPAQRTYTFNEILDKAFGMPDNAKDFTRWSQWLNYDGYRAIFESRSEHRRGMLLWMSHPAWPSMVWQTYDYYFEPTAAYFACRKACEPIHIQWHPLTNEVEVVSWFTSEEDDLTATAEVIDSQGNIVWTGSCPTTIGADQTVRCFPIEYPSGLSEVYFIRLRLTDTGGNIISENFYWQGLEKGNLKALHDVPEASVDTKIGKSSTDTEEFITVTLTNIGNSLAMMLRLKVKDSATDDLVLPVLYSDNYFFLMPGESKTITASVRKEDLRGKPQLHIEGFNVEETEL